MLPAEIIKKKRNGEALSEAEIQFFIEKYTAADLPDYQMSALLMAIYFKGMSESETLALTKTMLRSGAEVDLSDISLAKIDKHSTGGVGDKTSIILGPIVAACGISVPMISGRGLGHTGGTLDKLESIPGFTTQFSLKKFKETVKKHQLCFIGQTQEICPADKKIYALRDVTATVESLPLICASIMSKKIAAGIDGLVLDVKYGSGAFMKSTSEAEQLALGLIKIARGYGKKISALITNMNQPLGQFAGNALEIEECIAILKNNHTEKMQDCRTLSLELAARMLLLGNVGANLQECLALAESALSTGAAYKKFQEICTVHGGDLTKLPKAKHHLVIAANESGFVQSMDTEKIGVAAIEIRAGRAKITDSIDPTAGVEFHAKISDKAEQGQPLFTLYGDNANLLKNACSTVLSAYAISKQPVKKPELIWKEL